MDEFDLFANLNDIDKMYDIDNDSTINNETPNTSSFSEGASPVVKQTPERPRRSRRGKICVVPDEDTEFQLEPTPTRLIAARGQKLAVERFEKIKKRLEQKANLQPSDDDEPVCFDSKPQPRTTKKITKWTNSPFIVSTIDLLDDEEEASSKKPVELDVFDLENYVIQIKVNWNSKIERIPLRRHQKLKDICVTLAEREQTNPEDIILMINDKLIDQNETPDSIGYTIGKFIYARTVQNASHNRLKMKSDSSIEVKIQSLMWKKKPMLVTINKTDLLKVLVIKCAEELKLSPSKILLSFDGEPVDVESTPADLDLVDGEVFDLRII